MRDTYKNYLLEIKIYILKIKYSDMKLLKNQAELIRGLVNYKTGQRNDPECFTVTKIKNPKARLDKTNLK